MNQRLSVIGVLGPVCSLAAAVYVYWLLVTPPNALREALKVWQFWSLELLFVLVVTSVAVLRAEFVAASGFNRKDAVRVAILAAASLTLTLTLVPRTSRIFYDEQIYQSVGQNLADLRLAQVCNDGVAATGRLQCSSGEYNKQPYGYPHLLSLVYRVAGVRPSAAFAVNATAMVATTVAVYLLVLLLALDRAAALFGGLLFLSIPQQLMWSATAAVEPTASFALVLVLVVAAQFARSGSTRALVAVVVTAAYAVQFRPESLLVLPVVAIIIWPRLASELSGRRLQGAACLFFALVAVHVAHLAAVRDIGWGTTDARFSMAYVASNVRVNGWFYVYDERFPFAITALALCGLVGRGLPVARLAMTAYFLVFFVVDLLFYAGSYNYGADVRYSLLTYPPLAVLGGLGLSRLVTLLSARAPIAAGGLAVAALIFHFLWYAPSVRAMPEEAWAARADLRFAHEFAPQLPADSYVLTHNPGMFHVWGVNAGQMSQAAGNPAFARFLAGRFRGGVYVHWNFWCNVQDAVQPEFCRQALALGPSEMVKEHRERDQRFAFYRLDVSVM
jgi:hypothetical protein